MAAGKTIFVRLSILMPVLLLIIMPGCGREEGYGRYVDIRYIRINSPDDIIPLHDRTVEPLVYSGLVDIGKLPPDLRKRKFIELMLPSVLVVNNYLRGVRERVERIAYKKKRKIWLRSAEKEFIRKKMAAFRARNMEHLKMKLAVHPVSIVLAQAALESGWGSSRFFVEGNNVFGVWAFDDDEPRLEAEESRIGRSVYLKKYDTLLDSILDYYRTIARGPYREFRNRRLLSDDPDELTPLLYNYSESRDRYVAKLTAVIADAGLERFDNYILDPEYIK